MTGLVDWTTDVALVPVDEHRFVARLPEHWVALKGVHGGFVAALMVEAVERVLRDEGVDAGATLRSATFGYLAPNEVGDCTIAVDVVRRGRSMVTSHATVLRDGTTTAVGRLHHSTPRAGHRFSDVTPPPPRPLGTVRLDPPEARHLRNVESYLHPDTSLTAAGDRAEWIAWSRPLVDGTIDAAWLTMFGDYFPPSVFARVGRPSPAVSVEYSIQIHDDAGRWALGPDEFLFARVHAFHSHDGFAVEDALVHLPDGTLLATVRQTRLAG